MFDPKGAVSFGAAKRSITKAFTAASLDTPGLDARLLLCRASGLSPTDLIIESDKSISLETLETLNALITRRLSGEPIDHILGYREFYGRKFSVNTDVLSPRPETESIIDLALEHIAKTKALTALDLGTGSGAIAITLGLEAPGLGITAIDISPKALDCARANANAHGQHGKINFLCGDWFSPLEDQRFDIILSNPPYIDGPAMQALMPEVKQFDPNLALFGGEDGLDAYRHIAVHSIDHLNSGGLLLLEIGYDQALAVSKLLKAQGFKAINVHKDLAGHDRIVSAQHI